MEERRRGGLDEWRRGGLEEEMPSGLIFVSLSCENASRWDETAAMAAATLIG